MSRIKLLVDARSVGGEGQGMTTYLEGMYNAFYQQFKDNYELFFAGYDQQAIQELFPFCQDHHFLPVKSRNRWKLFFLEFPKMIRKNKIDFAHFQYVCPFIKTCPYITTTHDVLFLDFPKEFSWWYRFKRKLLFKWSLEKSDIRLTVSDYSRKRLSKHFALPAHSIQVTPNGVASVYYQPFNKKNIRRLIKDKYGIENYILFVSRLERRKNHQLLLNAFKELKLADKGIHLVIVGNNTLNEKSLTDQVKEMINAYPGQVHWIRYLEKQELLQFYQGANLFVFPSKAEGFGIPPIEAAALGTPVLCGNNTAMQDFSFFGENHFDVDDPEAFKVKLLKNLNTPASPDQLAEITETIRSTYSWERSASVLQSAIQSILPNRNQKTIINNQKPKTLLTSLQS